MSMQYWLVALLMLAAASDVTCRRIPNLFVLIGLSAGLLGQYLLSGSLAQAGYGALAGLGLFIPFYALGGMAAGDVKLMAVVGSFLGPLGAAWAAAMTLIAGSLIGILILLWRGQFFKLVQRYWVMASLRAYVPAEAGDASQQRFPFAVAILLGTVTSVFWLPLRS
ncbi:prepilin peptidase [Pseudomonas sp. CAU 1711]|uniref:A24 family peptidase n=1 Tax=Pseudomonas sp. CAU 1711 TaxID=3140356 RepID=UPI0032605EF0